MFKKLYKFFIFHFSFFIFLFVGCKKEETPTLFKKLDGSVTGITFNNTIVENDTLNILTSEFIYNGGGVAVGDLNGDGLQDLYFTGNQVENKLYLNKGKMKFEDITEKSGAQKRKGQWSAGVTILDINRDGKQDIYVCNTFVNNPVLRENLLFINQGNDTQGVPHFKEMAHEYGIADTTHSANCQFFDYDNDGDLDLFLSVNFMDTKYPNQFFKKPSDGSSPNRDRLYRNDWNEKLGHPVFTDVSLTSGIKLEGYSHSALVADFNDDGWLDIYVANDYVSNDLLYINNKNGTFTNRIAEMFKHQAASAMGSDIGDANNDGKLDVFTTEMLPYFNKRKKLFQGPNNYNVYINNASYGYEFQFFRNQLQINRGSDPKTGLNVFSDCSLIGDVQETDWSWTPLFADFDNDGFRDILVTNGFPRDVTDHDFGAYNQEYSNLISKIDLQNLIPQVKIPKFLFKNNGDLHFTDVSKAWGMTASAFTNGAIYADLDNDGDLDLVMNNIDDKAFVFENTLNNNSEPLALRREPQTDSSKLKAQTLKLNNYLRLKIIGEKENPDAFGVKATVYFDNKVQAVQMLSNRGYMSASENFVHVGLGSATKVDSVVITGRNNKTWSFLNLGIGYWVLDISGTKNKLEANVLYPAVNSQQSKLKSNTQYLIPNTQTGLNLICRDSDFIDFNFQKTIPHKFSQYGPSVSVGDINGDGLEDMYVSGSAFYDGTWFIQSADGKFTKKSVTYKTDPKKSEEELGTLLFDADGDGDLDLYIVHGSAQYDRGSPFYQDVLMINDGKGNFKMSENALPKETECGQAVKAADYDGDGKLDLFIGGRIMPHTFPKSDKSFILHNDSKVKDAPHFTDVTAQVCPELSNIGMVTDAIWTDFDGDGKIDLIVTCEWSPILFFKNMGGTFKNISKETGIGDKLGWWTSIIAGDFDNDGDIDYVVGNFGENLYFKCNSGEPMTLYAKDFDGNGLYDPFISCFWRDSVGNRKEYFYPTRDDMIKQLVLIRRKFKTYAEYGNATVKEVFTEKEMEGAQILKTNWMSSSFIENLGNGKFKISKLPTQAQLAPIYGMMPYDIDHDGKLDILMVGNDYGMELLNGRADAFYGLVLKNKGNNEFQPVELNESGFYVPGDARALSRIVSAKGNDLIVATQNKDSLKVFSAVSFQLSAIGNKHTKLKNVLHPTSTEIKCTILYKNGQKQTQEFYWGNAFLSQSSRSILLDDNIQEIIFFDGKNNITRKESEVHPK